MSLYQRLHENFLYNKLSQLIKYQKTFGEVEEMYIPEESNFLNKKSIIRPGAWFKLGVLYLKFKEIFLRPEKESGHPNMLNARVSTI